MNRLLLIVVLFITMQEILQIENDSVFEIPSALLKSTKYSSILIVIIYIKIINLLI